MPMALLARFPICGQAVSVSRDGDKLSVRERLETIAGNISPKTVGTIIFFLLSVDVGSSDAGGDRR